MKFWQRILDFVTDSNGDGDLLKLFGFVIMICGIIGYFQGRDPIVMLGFGSGLLGAGKALDAIIPKPK